MLVSKKSTIIYKFMKQKITIVCLGLILISFAATAQQRLDIKLDNKPTVRVKEYYKDLKNAFVMGLRLDYQYPAFYNSLYYENLKANNIEFSGGLDFVWSMNIAPVMLDIGYFTSTFSVEDPNFYKGSKDKETTLRGMDFYASYLFLPDYGRISRIFMPYIGIGYQTSSLAVKIPGEKSTTLGSYGTGSMMWKTGVTINLGKLLYINAEYRQGLTASHPESFNVLSAGIGVRMSNY
jgi:hypothetical protein